MTLHELTSGEHTEWPEWVTEQQREEILATAIPTTVFTLPQSKGPRLGGDEGLRLLE